MLAIYVFHIFLERIMDKFWTILLFISKKCVTEKKTYVKFMFSKKSTKNSEIFELWFVVYLIIAHRNA